MTSICPDTNFASSGTAAAAPTASRASNATLLIACLATGAIAMTITTSSTALANVQSDLQLGITQLQWVLNGFIVSFAMLLLPFGALSDRTGPRPLFVLGTVTFVLGAGIAICAPGLSVLLGGRFVQGLGAALLTATAPAALTTAFALEADRKRAFGYLGASGGVGLTLGALLAGMVVSWGGWRAAFALPIPVVVASLLITLVSRDALARSRPDPSRARVFAPSVFRNGQFLLACFACVLFTTVWVALFIYVPIHMQSADGRSPQDVGTTLLALMLPALVMPIVASRLVLVFHVGSVLIAAFLATALGLWIIDLSWGDSISWWGEIVGLVLCGSGAGALYGLVDYVGLTAVPPAQAGTASGAFNVVRLLGDIFAALIPGAVILQAVRHNFVSHGFVDVPADMLDKIAAGDLHTAKHLGLTAQAHASFEIGMSHALWVLIGLTALGVIISIIVRKAVR
jgi:predicted MFS family arabinose efflux permease